MKTTPPDVFSSDSSDDFVVLLKLNAAQAHVVSQALDLFSRLGSGQIEKIVDLVHEGVIPFHADAPFLKPKSTALDLQLKEDAHRAIKGLCAGISHELGFPVKGRYGISHSAVPVPARIAYEIDKVLTQAVAVHKDPNPESPSVHHRGLTTRYTPMPAPEVTVFRSSPPDDLLSPASDRHSVAPGSAQASPSAF